MRGQKGFGGLEETETSELLLLAPTSLRYHNLHPDYIHGRLQSLGKNFALRVLLIQVDVVSRGRSPAGLTGPISEMGSAGPRGCAAYCWIPSERKCS